MERGTYGQAADNPSGAPGARLSSGQTLGGRYVVRRLARTGIFSEEYDADDQRAGHGVAVHVLRVELGDARELEGALVQRARSLAAARGPAIAAVLDAGVEGGTAYVATEASPGNTLAELLARKRATGGSAFGARSALNLGAQLFAALAAVHAHGVHGALSPAAVIVSPDGEVRLADLAFAPALSPAKQAGIWPEHAPLAPELAQGGAPSRASDVFAAGSMLYLLAVGALPSPGCPRPSQAAPGLPPEVDEIIARCMLPDPSARTADAGAVYRALAAAQSAMSTPNAAAAPAAQPSLSQSIAAADGSAAPNDALSAALADADERWLVTKNKLDYGPFSTAELVEQIRIDQVLPGHLIIDNSSGQRHNVEDHPLFAEVADRARQVRDDRRRAHAEESHTVRERRRGVALYGMIAAGVLALGGAAYAIVGKLAEDSGGGDSAAVASIDEEAQLQVKMTTPEVQKPRRRSGGGRRGGGSGALGYDDTQSFDMGSGGGGTERLSNAQLNQTIQGYGGKLGRCLTRTGSNRADIEFIVKGDGKVSGVRVNGKTNSSLASCISGVMRSMQFPTFDGTRTRGTFNISL